ncbi:hypothetical protein Tco_0316489 [Tanacetum coccineum]
MSADSAVTYTSVHSEARSWSIPSEDPYEEAARQLLEQAPRSPEYVPEDHVPVYIPEPEHPEDLVPAEDEAPIPPLPPFFLAPRIRPPHTRAAMRQMRATAPSTYHSLLLSGTPPLLPIPLPAPSTSRRANIPETDTPPRKRLLLTTPRPECEVDVCTRESLEFCTQHHDAQKDRAAVRAEIEVLRRERLAYEQESIQSRQDLARSEAYSRTLEARITLLETEARRHEWQRQAADDLAVRHIMRIQALEAGARIDTLEDTASRRYRSFVLQKARKRSTRSTRAPPTPNEPTTTVTEAQLQALIDQGVAAAMAEAEASRALRESSDSLDGLRKWNLFSALAIAQQLAKSSSLLALCKMMLLHGGMPMLRPLLLKQLMPCPWVRLAMKTDKYCPRVRIRRLRRDVESKVKARCGGLIVDDSATSLMCQECSQKR